MTNEQLILAISVASKKLHAAEPTIDSMHVTIKEVGAMLNLVEQMYIKEQSNRQCREQI